jgi:hypothetical protein
LDVLEVGDDENLDGDVDGGEAADLATSTDDELR